MRNSLKIFVAVALLVSTLQAAEPPSPMFFGLTLEPEPTTAPAPAPMLFGLSQETVCENGVCRPVSNGFGLVPIAPIVELPTPVSQPVTPIAPDVSTPVSQPVTPVVSTPIAPVAQPVIPVAQPMSVPIYQTATPVYYQTATPVYYQTATPVYYQTATPVYFEPVQVKRQRFRPFRRFLERRRRIFRARWCR